MRTHMAPVRKARTPTSHSLPSPSYCSKDSIYETGSSSRFSAVQGRRRCSASMRTSGFPALSVRHEPAAREGVVISAWSSASLCSGSRRRTRAPVFHQRLYEKDVSALAANGLWQPGPGLFIHGRRDATG